MSVIVDVMFTLIYPFVCTVVEAVAIY